MGRQLSLSNLSISELTALRLNGELSPTLDFWEEPDDWRTRSTSVLRHELHPLVLTGLSAVWALGLSTEPQHHTASTITLHRIREPKNSLLKIEQRNLKDGEILTSQDMGVTSPLRTITDILRSQCYESDSSKGAVSSIIDRFDISTEAIRSSLKSMTFFPYIRLALKRLELLQD